MGAGIGAFISVFPTFGLGMPLVILMNRYFKFNLISALAFSIISNPFTSPFFMLIGYKIGVVILGVHIEFNSKFWKENLENTGLTLLLGMTILSGITSLLTYFIAKIIVLKYRNRHPNKNKI